MLRRFPAISSSLEATGGLSRRISSGAKPSLVHGALRSSRSTKGQGQGCRVSSSCTVISARLAGQRGTSVSRATRKQPEQLHICALMHATAARSKFSPRSGREAGALSVARHSRARPHRLSKGSKQQESRTYKRERERGDRASGLAWLQVTPQEDPGRRLAEAPTLSLIYLVRKRRSGCWLSALDLRPAHFHVFDFAVVGRVFVFVFVGLQEGAAGKGACGPGLHLDVVDRSPATPVLAKVARQGPDGSQRRERPALSRSSQTSPSARCATTR